MGDIRAKWLLTRFYTRQKVVCVDDGGPDVVNYHVDVGYDADIDADISSEFS